VSFEQTIRSAIEFSGVGLHSGAPVQMRILPAPAGSGIVFRRVDLDGFVVEAVGKNVAKVSYATSLMKKGVLISTTEHLLSALLGLGLDNAIVDLDSLELPILDGSALPIVQAVLSAGLRRQRRKRVYMCIRREVEVRDGAKSIAVYPADSYRIHYCIDFPHPLIGNQEFTVELTNGSYLRQIAPARTFGFLRDEAALRNMGLIRGASEANAIVLTDEGIKNPPLRFPDEFVRHKVLDLIGDLALAGRRIQGHVIAERAGHAMHTALVQRLMRDRSAWELAHVYDEVPEPAEVGVGAGELAETLAVHA